MESCNTTEITPLKEVSAAGRKAGLNNNKEVSVSEGWQPWRGKKFVFLSTIALLICLVLIVVSSSRLLHHSYFNFQKDIDDDGYWIPGMIVGNYSLPITIVGTTNSMHGRRLSTALVEKIQFLFDTALMECFGFAMTEAQQTAQLILQKLDDHELQCPMCYWLLAMTYSPFINHPRLTDPKLEQAKAAAQMAVDATESLPNNTLSLKEQHLIHAMHLRYPAKATADSQTEGFEQYKNYLQQLHDDVWPPDNDKDIMAFLADAIMILHCNNDGYDFYENDKPQPEIEVAMQVLQQCLEISGRGGDDSSKRSRIPRHPLCQHLYIHITEPSDNKAKLASFTADQLAIAASTTQAQHLQHMPSHTCLRIGRYHDAVQANIIAHQSDEAFLKHHSNNNNTTPQHHIPYGPAHDTAFLVHAATLSGERQVAYHYADALRQHYQQYPDMPDYPNAELGWHIWRAVRLRFGDWDDILNDSNDDMPRHWPYAHVLGDYAKGVAVLASTQEDRIKVAMQHYRTMLEEWQPLVQDDFQGLATVALLSLDSAIVYAKGHYETALARIRLARREQERWAYTEPPGWHMSVAACEASLLLLMGETNQSIDMFLNDLDRIPENRFSLYGLWKANQQAGGDQDILDFYWHRWKDASQWADDPASEIAIFPNICPLYRHHGV